MTFGSNPADIIIVLDFTRRLYQQCKNADDAYFEIGREIRALHTVLRHLKYEVQAPESILNRDRALYARDLAPLIADCRYTLEDLEELIRKYGDIRTGDRDGSTTGRLWNQIKSSSIEMDQLGTVRVKLINHKSNITALLDAIQLRESNKVAATLDNHGGQLDIILDKVDSIASRMGQRDASLMTTYSDDDKEVWKSFRRELVAEGFSNDVLTRHKDVLRAYIREIDQNSLLEDVPVQAKAWQPLLSVLEQAQSPPPSPPSFNMANTSSDSSVKKLRAGEHTSPTRTPIDFAPQQSDFISRRLFSGASPKLQSLFDNLGSPVRIRSQRTGSLKDLNEHDISILDLETQSRSRTLEGSSEYEASEASEASIESGSDFSLPQSFSSKSSAHGTVGATREFVVLLMENTQLRNFYSSIRQNFEFTTFKSELHQLLREFSRDLSKEALIPIERESVRFFSQQRKRVAHTIGQEIFGLEDKSLLQSISQQQQLDTRERIEKYLKDAAQAKDSGVELSLHQEHMSNNNSSDDEDELEPFSNLELVKKFLISSKAFENLRVSISKLAAQGEGPATEMGSRHNMIELESKVREDERLSNIGVTQSPLSRMVIPELRTSVQAGRILQWSWFVHRLFRPKLEIGYRRLEWQCDCGMPLYGDFRGDSEEISKLVGEIQAHGYVVTRSGQRIKQIPANSGLTTGLNLAASAPQGLDASQTAQDLALSSTGTTSRALGETRNPTASSAVTTTPLPPVTNNSSKFVALCVNTGPFQKTYDEIDISASLRNTQMFHNFKTTYEACISSRKNPLRRWLTQPTDIEFIQFAVEGLRRVYPIPGSPDCTICAHADKKDGLVTARKYEPHPNGVALTHPPIPPHLFFHLWECPKDITPAVQNMWLNRLPKKLDEKLGKVCLGTRPDGELILGWGVFVIEGLHRQRILRLTVTIVALSMVISVAYSASTKDVSSGFAVGALLVGCWTIIIGALFSEWVVR
ncbi:hypothetical protein VE02_03469 [Pseudogymnoascus sp. 03VT05]|nr:hypothetical protein VE02_03469 [Pseudogymnoascus sp. 03VT05]